MSNEFHCLLAVCPKSKYLELFLDLRDLFLLSTKSIVISHDTHRLVLLHCLHLCPIFNSDNLLLLYHFQNIIGGFAKELVMGMDCPCLEDLVLPSSCCVGVVVVSACALWWCSSEFVSRTNSTTRVR